MPLADSAVTPASTDVRFGLKAMLLLMAGTAVGATALGGFLRQFPPEVQPRLWAYWSVLMSSICAALLLTARRRIRAEQRAGRVAYRLPPHSYVLPHAPRLATVSMGILALAWAPTCWVFGTFQLGQPGRIPWAAIANVNTVYSLIVFAVGVRILWWSQSIRFSEHGVVSRAEYLPWGNCRSWRWDTCYRNVVVLHFEELTYVAAMVPLRHREELARFLNERVAGRSPATARVTVGTATHSRNKSASES